MLKLHPALKGLGEFHELYNDGKVAEVYSDSDLKFKSIITEKQFVELMGTAQRKLGKVTQTKVSGWNSHKLNRTTTVVLTGAATFERGTGTEVFTFEIDGDKAVLVSYHIGSKDMMLR